MEKLYKIYYGENKKEYIRRYLKDEEIINGYLSEAKAFDLFYSSMIICNDYLKQNFDHLDYLIDSYSEEDNSYCDEFQIFIIDPEFDEEITIKATKKMENTLYYDYILDLYITGISDWGTNRSLVATDIKVKEDQEE